MEHDLDLPRVCVSSCKWQELTREIRDMRPSVTAAAARAGGEDSHSICRWIGTVGDYIQQASAFERSRPMQPSERKIRLESGRFLIGLVKMRLNGWQKMSAEQIRADLARTPLPQ